MDRPWRNSLRAAIAIAVAAPIIITGTVAAQVDARVSPGDDIQYVAPGERPPKLAEEYVPGRQRHKDARLAAEDASMLIGAFIDSQWQFTHGGHWLSADDRPHITVAFADGGDKVSREREIRREVPGDYELEIVDAEHSYFELDQARKELTRLRNEVRGPFEGAESRGADVLNSGIGVDVGENSVYVHLNQSERFGSAAQQESGLVPAEDNAEETEADLAEVATVPVRVTAGEATDTCTRVDCRHSMRGGLRLNFLGSGETFVCTSGFTTYGPSSGRRFVLTSGHCGSRNPWLQAGSSYGNTDRTINSGRNDIQRVVRTNTAWANRGLVWAEPDDRSRRVSNYISHANTGNVQVGLAGGNSSRLKRGYIFDRTYSPGAAYTDSFVAFRPNDASLDCPVHGDSGGAVIRNNTAYGVMKGRSGSCGSSAMFGYFSAIQFALDDLNLALITE